LSKFKKLLIYQGEYGLFFFDEDYIVQYIHENDASYSTEYHGPILKWANVKVETISQLTDKQKELVGKYED
jgi:hypothetical protein